MFSHYWFCNEKLNRNLVWPTHFLYEPLLFISTLLSNLMLKLSFEGSNYHFITIVIIKKNQILVASPWLHIPMIYFQLTSRHLLILQEISKTRTKQIISNDLVSKLCSKPSMHVIQYCWSMFTWNDFIPLHQYLFSLSLFFEVLKMLAQLDGTIDSNGNILILVNILHVSVVPGNVTFIVIFIYFHLVQLYGYLLFELSYCCSIPVISHNPTD